MKQPRIGLIDVLRGVAILAMITYHLSWDLSWFGHVDWQVTRDPAWRGFAASIAGTFLLLAGIGLGLAHANGIRWRPFWKREAVIAVAAAAVSIATSFTFGDTFVRFGILHAIAASSLLALPFVRAPAWAGFAAAAIVLTLPLWASTHLFDGQWLLWTGLGQPDMGAVDYVPLAPWSGLTLLGVALFRSLGKPERLKRLAAIDTSGPAARTLTLLGKHSLIIYLLHQPLLYGLVWSVSALGLAPDRSATVFVRDCTRSCAITFGDEAVCRTSCGCTLDTLQDQGIWDQLVAAPQDPDLRLQPNQTYQMCLRDTPSGLQPPD